MRKVEAVIAVLNWHQVHSWVDLAPSDDEPLPRRRVSMETLCDKYDITPLDFNTAGTC